ncbi:transcriptional regulator [Sediminitomix flava]|uniref:Transcriptional regulator n=1 Tax=Sediminitomix flava TaxID=379075 RepID=A0A315ZCP6_SEDFL|nr:transcriptional regulator [Sediminitomix flava]PWJ43321.1 hypothetical protein BC781_102870 [Sediminitomix flava]
MLDVLITSKTRIKLLLKFFLNPNTSSYLRSLESEFGESTNAIRLELNRMEKAGMLQTIMEGNKKIFSVNRGHPLFVDVQRIVQKYVGVDIIVNNIVRGLGDLKYVYLTGDIARGIDSSVIDLILVGDINRNYLTETIQKAEALISRKIRYLIYTEDEFSKEEVNKQQNLLIWTK